MHHLSCQITTIYQYIAIMLAVRLNNLHCKITTAIKQLYAINVLNTFMNIQIRNVGGEMHTFHHTKTKPPGGCGKSLNERVIESIESTDSFRTLNHSVTKHRRVAW